MLLLSLWRQLNVIAAFLVPSWIADNVRFAFNAIKQHTIYQIPNRTSKHCIDCQDFNSHWPRPLPRESIEQRTIGSFMSWSNVAVALPTCFVILLYSVFHRHVYPKHHAQHAWLISFFFLCLPMPTRPWSCMFLFVVAFMACISNDVVVEVVRVHIILPVSSCMSFHSDRWNVARNQDGRAFLVSYN